MEKEKIIELHQRVIDRLNATKIKYEDNSDFDEEEVSVDLTINFPCGRATRTIYLWDESDLVEFGAIAFEDFTLLGGFAAIANRKSGRIEGILSAPSQTKSLVLRRTTLLKALGLSETNGLISKNVLPSDDSNAPTVSFGPTTKMAKMLSQSRDQLGVSLFIETSKQTTHDAALAGLEKVSNSLFFGIDVNAELHFALLRHASSRRRGVANQSRATLNYPKNEYDKAPMALYWYARSAEGMPLLQFLAYYQVIEYYYPIYYNADMSKRIRAILKHPSFRIENDIDIAKVIASLRGSRHGNASERDQLRATLKECISQEDIKTFLAADPDRATHFLTKSKGVTSCLVNPENRQADLVYQTAERIYDIRCKIVHTKGDSEDGEVELLLPYSAEAERMHFDIDLARFVARQILITSSRRLETRPN
ncbi:hypothetical protein [Pseudoduganella namucuonensis]|uniref:Uncharacterized protein n=1 Tax=Pseudoduganella namucuonensis TaxID=1035707 RepID=A0A1I7I3R1_9BURK|nr:hypothetical protein [Pseudoduganella namucuonensis]SFU67547.1 hypothetical protein SAMN05216552_100769 [Pseudoduganella namucuonensis]